MRRTLEDWRSHVLGTHENDAFKPQTGGGSGCRHAVLARAGFRDQRRFAHMLGEQRLPERVVDLVRAGVQQILAFQPQREAEPVWTRWGSRSGAFPAPRSCGAGRPAPP